MSSSGERFTDIELGDKRLPACYGYITWKLLTLEEAMVDLRSKLPEVNRFVKLAKKHCTFPNDRNLTKDESATIYLYTMEMSDDVCIYRILNQTLRDEDRSSVRPWFAYLKLLDSAASKLPKFKGIVWRGVNKNVSQTFKKGKKITWWSISSCSTSVDVISSFLGKVPQSTLFNIECSTGRSISAYTCYPTENEVILMPGTTFEVVADPLHHHGGLHIVHLKEINDDDDDDDDDDSKSSVPTASASATGLAVASVEKKLKKLNLVGLDIPKNARWSQKGTTVAGGNGYGSANNQLNNPHGLFVDDDQTVIIADFDNHRIIQRKKNDTNGQVIAGGNGRGNQLNQLNYPADVLIDKETNSLIIADYGNRRVMRWSRLMGTTQGEILIDNIKCYGLALDDQRYLYVSDEEKHEVRRYKLDDDDKNGTVVAGGNGVGVGVGVNQLNTPRYLFVDQEQNVYVSDYWNHRVMKWTKNAKGIVVAGGNGQGSALTQLYHPEGLFVDTLGTLYISDSGNHRVLRWPQGALQGTVIAGGNGYGAGDNQFNSPLGLSFDRHGNLYVADRNNNRVQRFAIE